MAMVGTNMASQIVDSLQSNGKLEGMEPSDIAVMKADMTIFCNAMIDYIKTNLEVKGVQVSTSTGFLNTPTPLVPVPTDGGAAVSAQMVTNTTNKNLNQNNSGNVI